MFIHCCKIGHGHPEVHFTDLQFEVKGLTVIRLEVMTLLDTASLNKPVNSYESIRILTGVRVGLDVKCGGSRISSLKYEKKYAWA
jgi:hypothetical protein